MISKKFSNNSSISTIKDSEEEEIYQAGYWYDHYQIQNQWMRSTNQSTLINCILTTDNNSIKRHSFSSKLTKQDPQQIYLSFMRYLSTMNILIHKIQNKYIKRTWKFEISR